VAGQSSTAPASPPILDSLLASLIKIHTKNTPRTHSECTYHPISSHPLHEQRGVQSESQSVRGLVKSGTRGTHHRQDRRAGGHVCLRGRSTWCLTAGGVWAGVPLPVRGHEGDGLAVETDFTQIHARRVVPSGS